MEGSFLRTYLHEGERHGGQLAWEWLLERANALGICGGSAFKAMAGFGRHGKLSEANFVELAGSLAVEVEFIVTDREAQQLLDLIHREKMALFYSHMPARFGVVDLERIEPASIENDVHLSRPVMQAPRPAMKGSFLRFYVHEGHRHRHDVVWEWLLIQANKLGIRGGSAFKAMAGFGRHHMLREEKFFDLAGSSVIEIEFVVTNTEAQQLFELLHREKLAIFYAHIPTSFGVIDISAAEPPSLTSAI